MSWTPDETPLQLATETAWLQGGIVTGVAYGAVLVLFAMCFQSLWVRMRASSTRSRKSVFLLIYVSVVFVLGTILFATNSQFIQLGFINDRNFPGGPSAYIEEMFSIPENIASNITFVLANWCADSLMLWRCMVIYKDCKPFTRVIVVGLPSIMLMGSITLGILWLIQISSPSSSPSQAHGINYTTPYFGLALAVNIVVTIMIVLRLLFHRHRISKALGPGHGSHYTSVAAMIVESASLYSVFSLLFLIPFAVGNPVSNTFIQVLGEIDIIASFLIIYRVLQGKAWSNDTPTQDTPHIERNTSSMRLRRLAPIRMDPEDEPHHKTMEIQVAVDVDRSECST
ncbi:hypothetical protein BJ138DRAFT_7694 [Hygrophoropsis aurantiaca]|uniref:Uncharacterized protein n=1 Tax=Hygrophoropsis aurantiaca TaxID=72124 RepID=A0ACB8AUY2_9AGAM|nr:hypothetical protein BJ138DRAFT_7694 [Hygrophoropsis aurantiaca]